MIDTAGIGLLLHSLHSRYQPTGYRMVTIRDAYTDYVRLPGPLQHRTGPLWHDPSAFIKTFLNGTCGQYSPATLKIRKPYKPLQCLNWHAACSKAFQPRKSTEARHREEPIARKDDSRTANQLEAENLMSEMVDPRTDGRPQGPPLKFARKPNTNVSRAQCSRGQVSHLSQRIAHREGDNC